MTHWRGIFKVIEEMGELQQVLGKLGPFPDGNHPGHDESLTSMLSDELADLNAALDWFMNRNGIELDVDRYIKKYERFDEWILSGIETKKDTNVSTGQTQEKLDD